MYIVVRGRAKAEKLATCFELELEGKFTMKKKEIESVSPASFLLDRVKIECTRRTCARPRSLQAAAGRTLLCNAHSLPV